MMVFFALGIHFLLITIYAYLIFTGRSRLGTVHLVMALCLPFIGEACLLASEIGGIPANPVYHLALKKEKRMALKAEDWHCPENWKDIVLGDEQEARAFLMQAIDHESEKLPEILKQGLLSPSSEVSHISASRLMKMHSMYEDAISNAGRASREMPYNMPLLARYIDAVSAYRASGLPDRITCDMLKKEELELLDRYLQMRPNDAAYQEKRGHLMGNEVKA